jgi:predicted DNA-binding transcriptional regulator AlpA
MSLEHSPAQQQRRTRRIFQEERLYSADEVRAQLGGKVHVVTIWKWVKAGRLPQPIKVGPATSRFLGSELNAKLFGEGDND